MKKLLLAIIIISFSVITKAQLTGMNPNTASITQVLQTTVTGPGLFIQGSSPSGNLFSVYLTNGPTSIAIFDYGNFIFNNITVTSTDDFLTDFFTIPYNATPGQYLLTVVTGDIFNPWMNQQTYQLPNAFTVLPPDGYIQGTVYFDTNQNGIKDAGEPGIQNEYLRILPENYSLLSDASGNYSLPVMNGSHTVEWLIGSYHNYQLSSDSALYHVVVSSNTQGGFDFGLKTALLSMSINYSQIGGTVFTTITSDGAFSGPPNNVYLRKGGYYLNPTNVTVVNSNTMTCSITVPFSASYIGAYDLYMYWGSVNYGLPAAFTVTAFNAGITGKVYFDSNSNGVYDAGESLLANSKVQLTPGNNLAFTDTSGIYGFGTANGNYTVQYLPRNYETVTSASSYNVTVNNNVINGQDFGVEITPTFDSISLKVWHWLLRCNALQSVYVEITNNGGSPADGKIFFIKDPSMTNATSVPPPDYVNGDTLYWNFTSLGTGQSYLIYPTFTNPAAGTPVSFDVSANQYDAGNNLLFSETQNFSSTVSCAWDPNDKQVNPPGVQVPHYTLFGEDLYYTIRFQNTGNDTAFRVIIYDTLDADLDFNTFEFISSSHGVKTELNPANGALKFTFNNILLPDSNINEPMSHGEVTYRIKAQTGLPANTLINNTAYIVFDLNTPVITNTAFNTMVYVIPVGMDEVKTSGNGVVIYPNPFDRSAQLIFNNEKNEKFDLTITDPNGRKVFEKEISSDRYLIEKGMLNEGMYFYKLSNKNRTITFSGKFAVR